MLYLIMRFFSFLPVFVIIDSLCNKFWLSAILTIVATVVFYFISMIPIAGDIISLLVWIAAIPFVLVNGRIIFIVIYFIAFIVKLVSTILYFVEVSRRNKSDS